MTSVGTVSSRGYLYILIFHGRTRKYVATMRANDHPMPPALPPSSSNDGRFVHDSTPNQQLLSTKAIAKRVAASSEEHSNTVKHRTRT